MVVKTSEGSEIRSAQGLQFYPESPLILHASCSGNFDEGWFRSYINFGTAWSVAAPLFPLFVDADGKNVNNVTIRVQSRWSQSPEDELSISRKLLITAGRPGTRVAPHLVVEYQFQDNMLQVTPGSRLVRRGGKYSKLMPDTYVVHLFNSIDALIPGSTNLTSQPERRARDDAQTPKALPPARRRPGR